MLPRPTSASHVSGTGEICTIAEKRPPRCGTRREPISANPLACREENRGAALAEFGRRTGAPAGIAHNPRSSNVLFDGRCPRCFCADLVWRSRRGDRQARSRGRKDRFEGEEGREGGEEGREEREGCGEAGGREEVIPFATERSAPRTLVQAVRRVLSFRVGRFSPSFQAWGLLFALPNLRPGSSRRMPSQEFTMIRTIAAALAATVFVAFGARAEEPKTPTTSDAAKSEAATTRKAAKKSAKKAKKAKKAAPADSSATPAKYAVLGDPAST